MADEEKIPAITGPSWKIRRRIIVTSLLLCAFTILYIMFMGEDTRLNETIVMGSFGLAGAIISAYIFGATWEDNTTRVHESRSSGARRS